jgi:hypothetical protein
LTPSFMGRGWGLFDDHRWGLLDDR